MKTNMSKVFGIACLLVCTVVGVQAQNWTYPRAENGNTIVSRDAAGGIKSEALLTTEQKSWLMTTNTLTTSYNDNSEYNKVSAKLQVASTDASTSSTMADAFVKCKSYSQPDAAAGSWRLPTQRELMLMWMFKAQLTACGNITSAIDNFWSSTKSSSITNQAYYVSFSNGTTSGSQEDIDKYQYSVRCVRDL